MADDPVTSLLDREAIRSLMDRYCLALFKADVDLMLSLYWPEAYEEHGDYRGPATGFVAHFAPILRDRVSTVATLSYRQMDMASPTEASAHGFGHIVVVTGPTADVKTALVVTRYEDVLQKRDGEWRIIRRKADMVTKRAI
jgi:uncharacterized protein (TIGR02246 family)